MSSKQSLQIRAAPFLLTAALCLVSADFAQVRAQTNTFVVEAPISAIPVDLEISPNGLIAAVRSNHPTLTTPSDQRVSLWATGTTIPGQA